MTDAKQPTSATAPGGDAPTMQEYRREQQKLREMIERQRAVTRKLAQLEESIAQKEAAYLESAPNGNIITGFDNYIKGTGGAAAQRRKTGLTEQNRVFSRSSISYKPTSDAMTPGSMGSTPASHAPTPLSTSFRDVGASNHATPTSATAPKGNKKKKNDEDSEPDSAVGNKKRTTFGAGRK